MWSHAILPTFALVIDPIVLCNMLIIKKYILSEGGLILNAPILGHWLNIPCNLTMECHLRWRSISWKKCQFFHRLQQILPLLIIRGISTTSGAQGLAQETGVTIDIGFHTENLSVAE